MKSLLFIIALSLFEISCFTTKAPTVSPLKGTYLDKPFEIRSEKTFDEVWDKLIDLFAKSGLPIKIIDRSSGLLVSDRTRLTVTRENSKGDLYDPGAFIVVPSLYNSLKKKWENRTGDGPVTGEWNVRLKKDGAGTLVNVNIVNVKYYTTATQYALPTEVFYDDYKSTGVFEKRIAEIITK